MLTKILVALDNSDMSQDVFDEAVYLAKTTGASLMLLHVLSNFDEPSLEGFFIETNIYDAQLLTETHQKNLRDWEQIKQNRKNWLRSKCHLGISLGIKTEFTLNTGNPSKIICNIARSWDADIIVIGRRSSRRALSELFLGSVSSYVVHYAPCSVLTVQKHLQIKR
ncbi:MAG: universal stress protein [Cyanobacteria bacterium P01_D01_bin.50]